VKPQERWQTISIELSELPAELDCPEPYDGLRAVFFWKGVALGHCLLAASQLPLNRAQIAAVVSKAIPEAAGHWLVEDAFRSALPGLAESAISDSVEALNSLLQVDQPLGQLDSLLRNESPDVTQRLSVAICTHERPADLARCLTALSSSVAPPREILVIDNAPSSDETRAVVAQFPNVQYHEEPRRGLSYARNAALSVATSEIVAFIDDDVVPHPRWTESICRCFDDPKVMVATGLILPAQLETDAQRIFEQSFQFFYQGYRRRCFDAAYFAEMKSKGVPVWSIGAGANMALRRQVFQLGYTFDTRLGPGIFGGCGEDSELWYRLLADGWSCYYEPSACVFHYHRRELPALRHLVHQYMKGHVAALLLQFAKHRHRGDLRRLFLVLPVEYAILLLRLVATGFSLDNRILLRGAAGCISGLRFVFTRSREEAAVR
jgi:GT2 family glycosyltransferase